MVQCTNSDFLALNIREIVPCTICFRDAQAHCLTKDDGFLFLHRVMFEVFSICVQAKKRWVTLLAVQQEGYARKNPKWFKVSALVLMSLVYFVHLLNVVQGRFAKNAVFNLSICKSLITLLK
jgi:hypothetical protein